MASSIDSNCNHFQIITHYIRNTIKTLKTLPIALNFPYQHQQLEYIDTIFPENITVTNPKRSRFYKPIALKRIGCLLSLTLRSMAALRILTFSLVICILYPCDVFGVDPKFDPSTRMRLVLVPADAQVGSIIYRLRATDEEFDYPLTFEFVGDASSSTVKIDSLPCTKYNSVCQANVVLQRRLESGRYYDFQVSVKDTKGGMATQMCSITATNYTTPHDVIFPHKPGIIMVFEDAKRGTELDYVIARKNPLFQKPVYLELWGSPLFAIRQKIVSPETTEGTIFLLGPLDFEKQAMYHLTVLANDAYAEPGQDNRNIAGMEIVVIVQDVQDQPPVFTLAPPVTKLPAGILPGDKILEVHAEDGDKGNPRNVRYGLVSEGNPFTSFFDINDTSGEIFLMRPLDDITAITHVGDPVLLTVIAEEVKIGPEEPPAMAATVQLALFLPDRTNSAPYFENDHYVTRLDENAPQGTALTFTDPYVPRVYDDDTGKNGVFSLTLVDNNGTFEISPNVAERNTMFLIRVRDNTLLDYEERHEVQFQIFAQELGPATNLSATVNVTVFLNDVNDNPPVFEQSVYTVDLPENMTVGTKVVQVHANDMDSDSGSVRYTGILGYLNTSLNLDAVTGVITVSTKNHGFDREIMPEYHLYVEARDNDGIGNHAQVALVIKLIDINDETPLFEKDLYEFILAPNLLGFTTDAVIYALDKDATKPNNEVRYEIIYGNYEKRFALDKVTGELTVTKKIDLQSNSKKYLRTRRQALALDGTNSGMANDNDFFKLTARAYDMGVPVLYSTTIIRIYPPESRKRTVTFVVPGHNPDKSKTEETLSTITGGTVIIHEIRPLHLEEPGVQNLPKGNQDMNERSVVTATVLYDSSSVVDISQIQQRLSQHNSSFAIMTRDTNETDTLYKAENKLLFWLLILLATLVAVTILTLLLCCICSWCPLYGSATKRIVNISKTDDDVHLMHRDGKQTKSVQVAEWMERREAWSAEKPSNSRTKSTRWEFHNGCPQFNEDLRVPAEVEQNEKDDRHRFRSAEEHQKRVKIGNSNSVKDASNLSFHNSRTNLVNDPEVFIEDMIDDQDEIDNRKHFQRSKGNKQLAHKQRKFYDPGTSQKDDDSIRRHEIDRGSDIAYNTARSSLKNPREFFIKDGNVEILQLIPRDKKLDENNFDDDNIYANFPAKTSTNLSHPQLLMIDNTGKEILMRRFIEEQPDGKQIIREHYQIVTGTAHLQNMPNQIQPTATLKGDNFPIVKSGPNSIVYSQTEPEVKVIHTQPDQGAAEGFPIQLHHATSNQSLTQELENSLKQQNSLLRHILLEKEKLEVRCSRHELTLETQSLPGQSVTMATQTGCEACTQTENFIRRSRSENDDSMSEEEYEYVRLNPPNSPEEVYWLERKRQKRRLKHRRTLPNKRIIMVETVKRKIRTPIKEEDEFNENRRRSPPKKPLREGKTSLLRKQKMKEFYEAKSNLDSLNRDVLMEISDSLDDSASPSREQKRKKDMQQVVDTSNCEEDKDCSDHYVDSDTDEIVITTNRSTATASQQNVRKEAINNTKDKRLEFRTTDLPCNRKLNHIENQSSIELNATNKPKYYRQNGSKRPLQASIRKQGISEHRLSKQSVAKAPSSLKENFKIVTKDDTKYKPEPAPRKSPPKDGRLLKEDIAINKQHKLRIVKDKNHPLLQHSEHRFERENAPEVPAPPTKLPHYMYPETPPGINTEIQNQGSQQSQPQPSPIKENEVKVTNSKINLYVENHKTSQPPQTTSHNSQKLLNAATLEDDHDSGIAMNSLLNSIGRRNPISEKKSVFSIAYDDVSRVKKIQSGGESPQYS